MTGTRRIAITGGPGSGKTSLVGAFAAKGYATVQEAAIQIIEELNRELTVEGQKEWRRQNLTEFQRLIFERQVELERACLTLDADVVFFDRAVIDGVAYCRHFGRALPDGLEEAARRAQYERVFVLETIAEFQERKESGRFSDRAASIALGQALHDAYASFGHEPIWVADATIEQRVAFVERTLFG